LALLYALLDRSRDVRLQHLQAALSLWDYCERSCRWVFGERTGDRDADEILEGLKEAGEKGLTQTEIAGLFGRNRRAGEIRKALDLLLEAGLVIPGQPAVVGRAAEPWRLRHGH